MCGIVCAFDLKQKSEDLRPQILEMSKKIRHRGPDWSGIFSDENAILAHERLAIVDPASGKQPLFSPDGKVVLAGWSWAKSGSATMAHTRMKAPVEFSHREEKSIRSRAVSRMVTFGGHRMSMVFAYHCRAIASRLCLVK